MSQQHIGSSARTNKVAPAEVMLWYCMHPVPFRELTQVAAPLKSSHAAIRVAEDSDASEALVDEVNSHSKTCLDSKRITFFSILLKFHAQRTFLGDGLVATTPLNISVPPLTLLDRIQNSILD